MDNELIGMQTEAEGAAAQVTEQPDTTGEQSADAALKHWVEDMKVPREKAERFLKAKSRQAAAKITIHFFIHFLPLYFSTIIISQ